MPTQRIPPAVLALALALASCGAPAVRDTPAPVPLRLLTYNIKRGLGNDGVTDITRAAALIDALQPDLVALQEIDVGVRRSGRVDQMARLAELTGMEARFGKFMDYQGGAYGMGLLSRLPIRSSTNHPLPEGSEPRTALDAVVTLPGGQTLTFCSVHLYNTEAQRLAQAHAILQIYRDTDHPVILAGDFNSTPDDPVMGALSQTWHNPDKGDDPNTFSATAPNKEIDAILLRPRGQFEVTRVDVLDEPVISDHRPVLMELRYRPNP